MRVMYDSVTWQNCPPDGQLYAGYIDGWYRWPAEAWNHWQSLGKIVVTIAVSASTNDGIVLDCETGDATPAQCPGWVAKRRLAGVDPTVYCNTSVWPEVQGAFHAAGIPEPHYWVAAYPGGGAVIPPGAIAHQYGDPGPYDVSVVADYWPGVDGPAPLPPSPPLTSPFIAVGGPA